MAGGADQRIEPVAQGGAFPRWADERRFPRSCGGLDQGKLQVLASAQKAAFVLENTIGKLDRIGCNNFLLLSLLRGKLFL